MNDKRPICFVTGVGPGTSSAIARRFARTVGPLGVHVGYVAIDAIIDLEWTRKMAPDKPDDFFCKPEDIAEEVFRLSQQPRSAWSFDTIIRPCGEAW
ncbi:hypothetical protein [Sphingomonas sp. 37zxx]|uniref:hypothetical protein n=1 Tax=Sphingomonas sp. 37zxx TaxID=1550073 RepID=UPI0006916903|nr:hypothetical protein [Sphingomonas sp. 37zxx]